MTFTEHPLTPKILFGKSDHVGWIVFNNPDRHNAISFSMWQAIAALTSDFDKDPGIRVVVTRGTGGKPMFQGPIFQSSMTNSNRCPSCKVRLNLQQKTIANYCLESRSR